MTVRSALITIVIIAAIVCCVLASVKRPISGRQNWLAWALGLLAFAWLLVLHPDWLR